VDATQHVDTAVPPASAAVSVAPTKTAERELSAEEMEKKTMSLMEEYLHLNDLKVRVRYVPSNTTVEHYSCLVVYPVIVYFAVNCCVPLRVYFPIFQDALRYCDPVKQERACLTES
jgi:hypothetical protein